MIVESGCSGVHNHSAWSRDGFLEDAVPRVIMDHGGGHDVSLCFLIEILQSSDNISALQFIPEPSQRVPIFLSLGQHFPQKMHCLLQIGSRSPLHCQLLRTLNPWEKNKTLFFLPINPHTGLYYVLFIFFTL